jgi:predicted nucleotidyltransferase component of viral defense system
MFDYSMHEEYMRKILKDIFNSDVSKILAFKGGTLVYLVHDLDRFSTDIDLDILDASQEEIIIETIRSILPIHGEVKNETLGKTIHRWVFRYDERSMNIKVELNKRVRDHNTYEYKTIDGVKLNCMEKGSIFANKLVALSERIANRDLYDVHFFFKNKFPINDDIIIERTELSIDAFLEKLIQTLKTRYAEVSILSGLGEVLDDKQKAWAKKNLLTETIDQINNYLSLKS